MASPAVELAFRAMGTDVHLIAVGLEREDLERARRRIDWLEQRWSRFIATSELSRLNQAGKGRPTIVPLDTFALVSRAVQGWEETNGLYDPTIHDAVVAAGYDRDFALVPPQDAHPPNTGAPDAVPAPGCNGIELDPMLASVTLPAGVSLDLGGIGKGWTADLVAAELMAGGAEGVCVNLGGDLRVEGRSPTGDGWGIALDDPFGSHEPIGVVALTRGALATSSRSRRRWTVGGRPQHHLIDPRTGSPSDTAVVSATVIAGDAATAEVLAKAVFLAGSGDRADLLREHGAVAMLTTDIGRTMLGDFDRYLVKEQAA